MGFKDFAILVRPIESVQLAENTVNLLLFVGTSVIFWQICVCYMKTMIRGQLGQVYAQRHNVTISFYSKEYDTCKPDD